MATRARRCTRLHRRRHVRSASHRVRHLGRRGCSRCAARTPPACRTTDGRSRTRRAGATRHSSVLGKLIAELGPRHTIHAIGLTGQCPSIVPIDLRGMPLRPGIIYRDNRAVVEADAFRDAVRRRVSAQPHRPCPRRVPRRREDPLDPRARARGLQGGAPLPRADRVPRADADRRDRHRLDDGGGERAARPPQARVGGGAGRGGGARPVAAAGAAPVVVRSSVS